MTHQIKFSHQYEKMPTGSTDSKLLEVFDKDAKELCESFIKYDTEIKTWQDETSDNITPREYYELPRGRLIILLLLSSKGHLWTTVRRCTKEKRAYYLASRGTVFKCIIVEKDSSKPNVV